MPESEHQSTQPDDTPQTETAQEHTTNRPEGQPSPQARAQAEPVREVFREGVSNITSQEDASAAIDQALRQAGDTTAMEVREQEGETTNPAQDVQSAAQAADPSHHDLSALLNEAARALAKSYGDQREAVEQKLHEAMNPEQYGSDDASLQQSLTMLREETLKRMQPLQAFDARIFLAINHLPHTPATNRIMKLMTNAMNGGSGWILGLMLASLMDKRRALPALHEVTPPLWFATMLVEYPIKSYFRRRRPFIDVMQTIAVGRKPGTYSFPSGHTAAAFAGAWLVRSHYPELTTLWYALAATVGFSRIYLGVHYPGDVLSGAVTGTVIAEAIRWFLALEMEQMPTNRTA